MDKKKKGLILSIIGIIGLIAITAGVTYAFFYYAKEGTTENTITTGTITFLYTEVSGVGRGISIDDAYPISDTVGKAQTGEGKVFDFKVTSNTPNKASIYYEVTARKKDTSTLEEPAVKLYLTKVSGDSEEEVLLDNYSNLDQTTKVDSTKYIEKTIYNGRVPANSINYEQNFRLRMWIDEDVDFSPVEKEDGVVEYPYNDKKFTVTVNVYANAKVVTDTDIEEESKAEIVKLSVDGTELTAVEGQDYDYETTLPEETTSATIDIETISEYATVTVEKLDGLAYSSNVKRLAAKKTLELNPGNNYFKITVTSENGEIENEYKLKIYVTTYMDSSTELAIGTAVTAKDGSKWHVLESSASGVETVVLLSDYNLNSDGSYNTECGRDINSTYRCSPMAFDPDNTNMYNENDSNNIGYFIKNTYTPLVTESLLGTTNVTIPTAYQIANVEEISFNPNSGGNLSSSANYLLTTSWLLTTNYWTKTANTYYSYVTWVLSSEDVFLGFFPSHTSDRVGARPVITTPKTNLLAE